ncbi:hypothetical protein [Photobacterium leiognathi]|uniref:hypothetical protein n=1 Tax=Photobacterium leiognathi TaxID=553611 RepID=UPI0029826B4E|nr:hypothetical protein [Photobacterium leiognathi]
MQNKVNNINDIVFSLEQSLFESNWKGWDPYDGLNSKALKLFPFINKNDAFRIAWIQLFKHSPINLRRLLQVEKGINPKGLGLILSSYCNIIEALRSDCDLEGKFNEELLITRGAEVVDLLDELRSPGFDCYCWGYNFSWQSRAFYLPVYTPTVVATSFVTSALTSFYKLTGNNKAKSMAISTADFVTKHLNPINSNGGIGFSYSPIDNRMVYNASLLGTSILSNVYSLTEDPDLKDKAYDSVKAVIYAINNDGSITHSEQVGSNWRDNFHTGFKLESLMLFRKIFGEKKYDKKIQRAIKYWEDNFFEGGICKYYDNSKYPLDIHCPSQFFATKNSISDDFVTTIDENEVMEFMLNCFYNGDYFIFQRKKYYSISINYFRWGQAWALYGLTNYLKGTASDQQA